MSISPNADITGPRHSGQPLRLTPDAGPQAGIIDGERRATELAQANAAAAGGEPMSFWDLLDIINPLQHIPVVSGIYREMTGDEIRAPAKLAGGMLFGGVVGLASSAVDVLLKEVSGRDAGEHVAAMFGGGPSESADGNPLLVAEDGAAASATVTASATTAAAADASPPVVTAANTKWFPINRDQQTRPDIAPREPVRESMTQRRPAVEVVSPRPAAAASPAAEPAEPAAAPAEAAASLPLGVMSAASAAAPESAATFAPPPDAVRRALAAQGIRARDDHAMLRAVAEPASESPSAADSASASAGAQGSGPVDLPPWFDQAMERAMRSYNSSDQLAPDALAPTVAPGDRRGV